MHSGSSLPTENPAFSISIGIAALIIEGRPLYDDEYTLDSAQRRQSDYAQCDYTFQPPELKCYRAQIESPQSLLGKCVRVCKILEISHPHDMISI